MVKSVRAPDVSAASSISTVMSCALEKATSVKMAMTVRMGAKRKILMSKILMKTSPVWPFTMSRLRCRAGR